MSNQEISQGLKITFLMHFVIAGLVGLQHLFAPRVWTDLASIEITETVTWRTIGAALIAFAASSWMAYRESKWERVRIVIIMDIIWSVLGALTLLWGIFVEGLPSLEWINVIILLGFVIAFTVFFLRHKAE